MLLLNIFAKYYTARLYSAAFYMQLSFDVQLHIGSCPPKDIKNIFLPRAKILNVFAQGKNMKLNIFAYGKNVLCLASTSQVPRCQLLSQSWICKVHYLEQYPMASKCGTWAVSTPLGTTDRPIARILTFHEHNMWSKKVKPYTLHLLYAKYKLHNLLTRDFKLSLESNAKEIIQSILSILPLHDNFPSPFRPNGLNVLLLIPKAQRTRDSG